MLKIIFRSLAVIAILLTIFPFFNADAWYIRVFDYPHVQLTFLTLFILLFYFFKFEYKNWKDYIFSFALLICLTIQAVKIYPYTPFAAYEVQSASEDKISLKIFVANVLQKNKSHQKLIQQIKETQPDLFLLTETNQEWLTTIEKKIDNQYPYTVKVPLANTYGMLLYSKYKLEKTEVNYLIEDSIPSITTKVIFNKNTLQLYAIHPKPPTPQHAKTSKKRDTEMMLVAHRVLANKNTPTLVMGDFNDVAWSTTTTIFQEVSKLLDVRKGRGFYNTYNANSYIMRWPLDHVFVSEEFRVKDLQLLKKNGSDHLPIFLELTYEPKYKKFQEKEDPTTNELKKAKEQMK
ncbi:endonuclease/exonuclease/phosphatase family protein [Mesonia sp. JHPTF-M18]|uniref:Endonuclease/exonuclease/phosphatase family protein n=1 Tax=Mesonia aestuariivivens TaxID=2796128 RepID=A0ABS6VZR9_9FLAO|nr:endonuclease/exonuclease/phosphatase family protein [Mesonia aestuariivivens]